MGWRLGFGLVCSWFHLRSEPTVWDGDHLSSSSSISFNSRSEPTVWDGDAFKTASLSVIIRALSPPCRIATGTPIFANAPCGVERSDLSPPLHSCFECS